jgi:hypothetical protein
MKHAGDLQRLAQQFGWTPGPRTYAAIQRMTSDQTAWEAMFNKEEFEKGLSERDLKAKNRRDAEAEAVEKYWAGDQVTEEAVREIQKFIAAHPQFRADDMGNREALVNFLREHKQPVTQANLTEAFQILGRDGKLVLSPSKVGIIHILYNGRPADIRKEDFQVYKRRDPNAQEVLQDDDSVTGYRLARHSCLALLLSPHSPAIQAQREQAALSADDYKKQNPEAFPKSIPPLVEKKWRQAASSFASFHPEYIPSAENKKHMLAYLEKRNLPITLNNLEAAYAELTKDGYIQINPEAVVSAGNGTRMIDYGAPGRGKEVASLPEGNESLAYKIRNMTAKEYSDFIADPNNRRAVDRAVAAR